MGDLKLSVKLGAPSIEITGLQDAVQKHFDSNPIKVKFDVGGSKLSDSITNSAGVKRVTSEYTQLSNILKQVNSDRLNLEKISVGGDSSKVAVYADNIKRLSAEMATLLGVTSQAGQDTLTKYLQSGDVSGLVETWRRAGVESENIVSLLNQQAKAQHDIAVAAAGSADKVAKAETTKQAAAEKTAKVQAAQLERQQTNAKIEALKAQELITALQQQQQLAKASFGGDYFKSKESLAASFGLDKASVSIKTLSAKLNELQLAYQAFINTGDGEKLSAAFSSFNNAANQASKAFTNVRLEQQALNKEFKNKEHLDNAMYRIRAYWDENRKGIESNAVLLREFRKLEADGMAGKFDGNVGRSELNARFAGLKRVTQEAGAEVDSLTGKLGRLFNAHLSTALVMVGINALRRSVRKVYRNVVELDKAVVDLQIASGMSRNAIQSLLSDYSALGKQIGATTTEVAKSADTWLRQGETLQKTEKLIKDTMMLSKLGQIDSAESAQALTSSMKGYKVAAEDATSIVDKFVAVDLEAAVTAGGLAKSLSETAVSANIAGVSLDRVIGYIAKVSEVTQDSPQSIGNFFKSTFARMGNIKQGRLVDPETGEDLSNIETVLRGLGIELRENEHDWRNFQDVLDDVAAGWNTYSDTQRRAIANAFGMTRQQEKFLVLMENYDESLALAEVSANSAGTATEKYGAYMDGLEAHVNSLKSAFESLSATFLNSDWLKSFVDDLTSVTSVIDSLISKIGTVPTALGAVSLAMGAAGKGLVRDNGLFTFSNAWKGWKPTRNWATSKDIANLTALNALTEQYTKEIDANGLSQEAINRLLRNRIATSKEYNNVLKQSSQFVAKHSTDLGVETAALARVSKQASITATALKSMAIQAGIALVVAGIGLAISKIQKARQAAIDAMGAAGEAAKALSSDFKSLDEQAARIKELNKQLASNTLSQNEASSARLELMSVQDAIIDKYGVERSAIDGVTDSIENQIAKIKDREATEWWTSNKDAYGRAVDTLNTKDGGFGTKNLLFKSYSGGVEDEQNKYYQLYDIAKQAGLNVRSGSTGSGNAEYGAEIYSIGTYDERIAQLENFFGMLSDYADTESGKLIASDIEKIQNAISKVKRGIETNKEYINAKSAVDEGTKYLIAYDAEYHKINSGLVKAQEDMRKAVASGDSELIAAAYDSLMAMTDGLDLNSITDQYVKEYFKSLRDNMRKQAAQENFDNILEGLYSSPAFGKGRIDAAKDALKGFSRDELLSDGFKELSGVTAEQIAAFNLLYGAAERLNVPFDFLIGQLFDFSEASSSVDVVASSFTSLFDLVNSSTDEAKKSLSSLGDALKTALDWRSSEEAVKSAIDSINKLTGLKLSITDENITETLLLIQSYVDGDAKSFEDLLVTILKTLGISVDASGIVGAMGLIASSADSATASIRNLLVQLGMIEWVSDPHAPGGGFFKASTSNIGKMSSASKAGSSGSSKDKHLEAYQTAVKQLQFLRDTDVISETEYYRRLEALANQYLAGRSKYIDEYRSVLVDLHNFRKKQLEEQRDAELEALKTSTDARKKAAKDQYEAERKTYEAKKKALQDELKAYKEVIDAAKEKLRQEEAAYDHNKKVTEINHDIYLIEEELSALSLDDSAKANARKKELAEDLADRQADLAETQYKYSNDLQENALDREYDRMEKHINSEIDLIEASLERIASAYDALLESISASFDAMTEAIKAQYENMISSMQAAASGFALPYLSGQKNSQVGQVQQELINQGYLSGSGSQAADNIWGKQTEKAYIKAWQEYLNSLGAQLKVDGIRGSATKAAEKKYAVQFPTYHSGGVVGDGVKQSSTEFQKLYDLKPDEIIAKLLRNEVVLNEEQQGNLIEVFRKMFDVRSMIQASIPIASTSMPSGTVSPKEQIILEMPLHIYGTPDESVVRALEKTRSSIVSEAVKAVSTKSVNAVKFGSGLPIRSV